MSRLRTRALAGALSLVLVSFATAAACEPAAIATEVARLGDVDPQLRWEASAALGRCGAAAVPVLVEAMESSSPQVRESATRALGLLGSAAAAAVPPLIVHLADAEPLVRERAAEALGLVGPAAEAAIPTLIATFADADPYLGGAAAIALARIGPASVGPLATALGDARAEVRWSAAIALARLGTAAKPAGAALLAALADSEANVRAAAAYALGAFGSVLDAPERRAIDERLSDALADADAEVRRAVRTALRALAPSGPRPAPREEQVVATLERLVPRLMSEQHVPAVSIAVVEGGRVSWTKAWGVADVRTQAPATTATLFEAASMSKPVFALLAMQLAERGRLDLDTPLALQSPELAVPELATRARITPRMALAHTSGLPNWRPGGEEREGALPLLFAPGSRFSYSGEGIFALQRAVERLTGRPLDLLARRELFAPLGLATASYSWNEAVERLLASGHDEQGAFLERSRYLHPNAAYTLYVSASDYARILVAVMEAAVNGSALLSRSSASEMLREQVTLDAREPIERPGAAEGEKVEWGLGWSINQTAAGGIYHHSGANRTGFRSFSQFSPSRRTGLVVLTNGLGGGELWTRLVAAVGDL